MTHKILQKDIWELIKKAYVQYKELDIKINPYLFTYDIIELIERDNSVVINIMIKQKMYNRFKKSKRELYTYYLLKQASRTCLSRPNNKNNLGI